ncbi:MAG: hypothetical protein WCG55_03795 [bacterium]
MRKLIILLCVIVAFAPTTIFAQADSSARKPMPNVNSYLLSKSEEAGIKHPANWVFDLAESRVVEATIGLDNEQISLNWQRRGKKKTLHYRLVENDVKVEIVRRKSKIISLEYASKLPESEDRQNTRKIHFEPGKPFQISGFLNPQQALEAISEALDGAKEVLEELVEPPKGKKMRKHK